MESVDTEAIQNLRLTESTAQEKVDTCENGDNSKVPSSTITEKGDQKEAKLNESQQPDSAKELVLEANEGTSEAKPVNGKECKSKETKMGWGHQMLYSWLNKNMKIEMTDGRILIGVFLCTDRDGNVILGSCSEYINPEVCGFSDEPRILGLVMVPGRHIVSIHHDAGTPQTIEPETGMI